MSDTLLKDILYSLAPLIALTNPVAELPVFLSIIEGRPVSEKRSAAVKVAIGVLIVLVVVALAGMRILDAFGVSLAAFRAAGGLLLILMGLEMMQGEEPALQSAARAPGDPGDRIWVPLVMPMLAGPGAIVTTVSLTIREQTTAPIPVATLVAISVAAFLVFVHLFFAAEIAEHVGLRSRRILTRFGGLILVAIGFQMGLAGIAEFFGLEAAEALNK
jgi:multiple antibiotic resistance protein